MVETLESLAEAMVGTFGPGARTEIVTAEGPLQALTRLWSPVLGEPQLLKVVRMLMITKNLISLQALSPESSSCLIDDSIASFHYVNACIQCTMNKQPACC